MNKYLLILISILSFISCINNHNKDIDPYHYDSERQNKFFIDIPDKVKKDSFFQGKINYFGFLDSIKTDLGDKQKTGKWRGILFSYQFVKDTSYSMQDLENSKNLDSVVAHQNVHEIYLKPSFFENKGEYFIDGILEDMVYLKQDSLSQKSRLISRRFRLSKKIKVID